MDELKKQLHWWKRNMHIDVEVTTKEWPPEDEVFTTLLINLRTDETYHIFSIEEAESMLAILTEAVATAKKFKEAGLDGA